MILADTSVWIDHFRRGILAWLRCSGRHRSRDIRPSPGEIALGHLKRRTDTLTLLASLPQAAPADHEEVPRFVAENQLSGSGLGWIDVHLLAAAALDRSRLWTLDKRLRAVASRLGLEDRL